jgi:hypothetical protein
MVAPEATTTRVEASSSEVECVVVTSLSESVLGSERGTVQHKNMARLCDAWLAWSFQANFVFEPILL